MTTALTPPARTTTSTATSTTALTPEALLPAPRSQASAAPVPASRALRIALRSHENHLGTAIAVNLAAVAAIRSRELGRPLRVGVLLSPYATDSWRTLSAYGSSFVPALQRHLNASESSVQELQRRFPDHLATPGGLEGACAAIRGVSDEELTELCAGGLWGLAVVPGVCTPWLGDCSRDHLLALEVAMHERTISYLEDTCDVVVLAPRADRVQRAVALPAASADTEVAVVEANAAGAAIARSHPGARLGALRGTASSQNYATEGELSTSELAALCARVPDAEATLNLYQLEGGRGGGLFAAGQRGERAGELAFAALASTLLASLPGLEFLGDPLPPEPLVRRRGLLGRLRGAR